MRNKLLTKSFFTRAASAILLVAVAAASLIAGDFILLAVLWLISLVGLFELYRVFQIQGKLLGIIGYAAVCSYYVLLFFEKKEHMMLVVIVFLMAVMAVYAAAFPKYRSEQIFAAFFGLFYVAVMLSYVYQTRMLGEGIYLIWLVFISSWICDTCAYLVGVTFGKHKLTPVLSPNKSVEGAIGGIAGSFILGALYGFLFRPQLTGTFLNPLMGCGVVCSVSAVISQIGDLAASAIKRSNGVKDYGTLIPGHGGILDRFDSVIFVAPAIYFLCVWIH